MWGWLDTFLLDEWKELWSDLPIEMKRMPNIQGSTISPKLFYNAEMYWHKRCHSVSPTKLHPALLVYISRIYAKIWHYNHCANSKKATQMRIGAKAAHKLIGENDPKMKKHIREKWRCNLFLQMTHLITWFTFAFLNSQVQNIRTNLRSSDLLQRKVKYK